MTKWEHLLTLLGHSKKGKQKPWEKEVTSLVRERRKGGAKQFYKGTKANSSSNLGEGKKNELSEPSHPTTRNVFDKEEVYCCTQLAGPCQKMWGKERPPLEAICAPQRGGCAEKSPSLTRKLKLREKRGKGKRLQFRAFPSGGRSSIEETRSPGGDVVRDHKKSRRSETVAKKNWPRRRKSSNKFCIRSEGQNHRRDVLEGESQGTIRSEDFPRGTDRSYSEEAEKGGLEKISQMQVRTPTA